MKVTTFGESLFRLSTHKGERIKNASEMNFYLGGTELNIAANLKSLGVEAAWVSSLPDGMMGDLMREKIAALGVETSHVETIRGGRAGWYVMESGAAPRPDVVLNRYASSLADQNFFSFDWTKILKGSVLFHTSGVATGLSETLTAEVVKAMTEAKNQKALVSYDFNYRKNIWSIDAFIERQKPLIPLIDILFCAESDLTLFFKGKSHAEILKETNLKYLVINQRTDESEYGLKVVSAPESYDSKRHKFQSIDRIGVGDSMAAGFIAGLLKTSDPKLACEWGSLAGALKYGIQGDMALLKESELNLLLQEGPRGILR